MTAPLYHTVLAIYKAWLTNSPKMHHSSVLRPTSKGLSVLINHFNVTDEVTRAIKIENQPLTMCTNFTYVGSTNSEAAKIDQEITLRIGKASGEGRSSIYGGNNNRDEPEMAR